MIENNSAKREKLSVFCPNCNSIVEAELLFEYAYGVEYEDELQGKGITVQLAKCLNCENPFLFNEDFIEIEGNYFSQGKTQLYPVKESEFVANAPNSIIKPYKEAIKCFRANAYEACVIMCRKGIDALCQDKGETRGNLKSKLKNLKEKGVLENTFYNWSNKLREIGNIGAHSHDIEINKQDAKDTLEFFEALILYLYHLVSKYDEFIKRKNQEKPGHNNGS